ncbi:hypothetical protein F7P69_01360 [Cellulosimicrobium funkei]|nr:hypothetical protein [Cellulosimicrobium funkei]
MPAFVIQYNRRTGDREVTSFSDKDGHRLAFKERMRLERQRTDADVEIVSIISDSLDSIKLTHSRYFRDEMASA